MQVDPIRPTVTVPGTQRLTLKHDKLIPSFAFNFDLRRYTKVKESINYENGRQRLATILMYLNHVEEGGETVFPHPTAAWAPGADTTGGADGGGGDGGNDGGGDGGGGDGGGAAWSTCAARGRD